MAWMLLAVFGLPCYAVSGLVLGVWQWAADLREEWRWGRG